MTKILLKGVLCNYSFNYPEDKLGEGSMSLTYRGKVENVNINSPIGGAFDKLGLSYGSDVAVKVLKSERKNETFIRIFRKGNISIINENVMKVYDYVIMGDYPNTANHHLILELIKGEKLIDYIKKSNGINELLELMIQVANGVKSIHDAGYLHCDIKPENILINNKGVLKIIDFDTLIKIDEQSKNEKYSGTPSYSSPEQLKLETNQSNLLDEQSDIYSMGILFYEIIFSETPYSHIRGRQEILEYLENIEYLDLLDSNSITLNTILENCLAIKKEKRYKSVSEVQNELIWLKANRNKFWFKFYDRFLILGDFPILIKLLIIVSFILVILTLILSIV